MVSEIIEDKQSNRQTLSLYNISIDYCNSMYFYVTRHDYLRLHHVGVTDILTIQQSILVFNNVFPKIESDSFNLQIYVLRTKIHKIVKFQPNR